MKFDKTYVIDDKSRKWGQKMGYAGIEKYNDPSWFNGEPSRYLLEYIIDPSEDTGDHIKNPINEKYGFKGMKIWWPSNKPASYSSYKWRVLYDGVKDITYVNNCRRK